MNPLPRCAMCSSPAGRVPRRLHPVFSLRSFTLCVSCEAELRNRLVKVGCTPREGTSSPSPAHSTPNKHPAQLLPNREFDTAPSEELQMAARLVTLAEELLWTTRDNSAAAAIRARVREDEVAGVQHALPALGVDRAIISVARSVLTAVGVSLAGDRLVFPVGPVALPPLDDAHAAVEAALLPLGAGPRSGAAAWNAAFPDCNWNAGVPLRVLYQKLYSLFGIRIAPALRASRRRAVEHLALNSTSVARAMAAAVKIAPPALKSLLAPPGDTLPAHLTHAAAAMDAAVMLNGNIKCGVCACCGCERHCANFPFRIAQCSGCEKQICSVCLLRVFGPSELARGFAGAFLCPKCRIKFAAAAPAKGDTPLRRMRTMRTARLQKRLKSAILGKGRIAKTPRPKLPLLVISRTLAMSIQRLGASSSQPNSLPTPPPSRPDIGFAKLCDDINFGCMPSSNAPIDIESDLDPLPTTVCITCRLPLGAPPDYGWEMDFNFPVYQSSIACNGLAKCSDSNCDIVVHAACTGLNAAAGEAGAIAAWKCGHHQCIECNSSLIEARCRTCPVAYCHEHAPLRDNVHQYSAEWISCSICKDMLDTPRFPHEADHAVRIENGASALTLSEAFQREQDFGVVHVNSMAEMHDSGDMRDAAEVRAGITKCRALRQRRALRDSEKRFLAEDLRAAQEKEAIEKVNERAKEAPSEVLPEVSPEKSTGVSRLPNGRFKSKSRVRERDLVDRERQEKSKKMRMLKGDEGNDRDKARPVKEKEGHVVEKPVGSGASKSRGKVRWEKEVDNGAKTIVPNGKKSNGNVSTAGVNRSAHPSNVDAVASGAGSTRTRFSFRSYPNGIRQ